MADPVYEGKAIRGLLNLAAEGRFEPDSRILLMHLGGTRRSTPMPASFPRWSLRDSNLERVAPDYPVRVASAPLDFPILDPSNPPGYTLLPCTGPYSGSSSPSSSPN